MTSGASQNDSSCVHLQAKGLRQFVGQFRQTTFALLQFECAHADFISEIMTSGASQNDGQIKPNSFSTNGIHRW